jgi:hypothetical protein
MAQPIVNVTVLLNEFPKLLRQMPGRALNARKQAAENIVAGCRTRSRVRTGAMRAGWHATHGIEMSTVTDDVPWTVFNEYGTSRMSAQPMLGPASEEERAKFPAALIETVVDLT